jgi:hypothetical protein
LVRISDQFFAPVPIITSYSVQIYDSNKLPSQFRIGMPRRACEVLAKII